MRFDALDQTIAGLTGGIASGKSTVTKMMMAAGARIVDADCIAHRVVRKEKPAWRDIVQHFGTAVLDADGEINRPALGALVFSDVHARQTLEGIVHPRVHEAMQGEIRQLVIEHPGDLIILDVPLLIESGWQTDLPVVILVYVPEKIQLARLMHRDGLNAADATERIRAQMPIDAKRKHADYIIDNTGSREATHRQVLDIYHRLHATGKSPVPINRSSPP